MIVRIAEVIDGAVVAVDVGDKDVDAPSATSRSSKSGGAQGHHQTWMADCEWFVHRSAGLLDQRVA
jgi:hypothetical protein